MGAGDDFAPSSFFGGSNSQKSLFPALDEETKTNAPYPLFPREPLEQTFAYALLCGRIISIKDTIRLKTADLKGYIRNLKERYWSISHFDNRENGRHANKQLRTHTIRYYFLTPAEIAYLTKCFPDWRQRICDKAKTPQRPLGKKVNSYWLKKMQFAETKKRGSPNELFC